MTHSYPDIRFALERFARTTRAELPPHWEAVLRDFDVAPGPNAVVELARLNGWPAPLVLAAAPKPQDCPCLGYLSGRGWVLVDQWEADDQLRVTDCDGWTTVQPNSFDSIVRPVLPDVLRIGLGDRAIDVFKGALMQRWRLFAIAILATVVVNLIALVTSLYSMQVYDRVIPRAGYSTLIVLTIGAGFALLLDFALRVTRSIMVEREAALIDEEMNEFFFARAQAIRLDARPPAVGTLAAQLRGIEQVRALMSSGTLFLIADMPFALFFILIIYWLGGVIALVPLIAFPLSLGLALIFERLIRRTTDRAQVSGHQKNGLLIEAFDAAETIKAASAEWTMIGRWNSLVHEVHRHEDPIKNTNAVATTLFATLQQLSYIALIAFGAVQVATGAMTAGALIACGIIAGRVNGPLLAMLPGMLIQWGYARSSLKALDSILALPTDNSAHAGVLRPESLGSIVKCEALSFSYRNGPVVVEVPSMVFKPGERVAIIGGIGSGKSTLLKILAGLYRPTQGQVLFDNIDVANIAPDLVRRHCGYLAQDARLINGTLRENLILGLPDPGDEAIRLACQETGLIDMINGNPAGLGLAISEGGRGLSGGQRMLTALTRMVIARPQIVLLDEPTASLDQTSEARALDAVFRSMQASTIGVLVTHKLQLLSIVQRVIVINNGRVVHDGPTKEVIDRLRFKSAAATTSAGAAA